MHVLVIVVVVVVIVVVALLRRKKNGRPLAKRQEPRETDHVNSIFVSVPSYRDGDECALTLVSLYEQATSPHRITVGVYEQEDEAVVESTGSIVDRYKALCQQRKLRDYSDNVRVITVDASEARGPMVARAVIEQTLYRQERYVMTVDSHMRFAPSWDDLVLDQYGKCLGYSKRPILTAMPGDYQRGSRPLQADTRATYLAVDRADASGFPVLKGLPFERPPGRCYPSLFYCPCFSFAFGTLLKESPCDINYDFVFFPEAYVQSARYWTRGWDFFSPKTPVVYHCNDRSYRPTYWERMKDNKQAYHKHAMAVDRARSLLRVNPCRVCSLPYEEHMSDDLGHRFQAEYAHKAPLHSLGRKRSLQAYADYCGVVVGCNPAETVVRTSALIGSQEGIDVDEQVHKYASVNNYKVLTSDPDQFVK